MRNEEAVNDLSENSVGWWDAVLFGNEMRYMRSIEELTQSFEARSFRDDMIKKRNTKKNKAHVKDLGLLRWSLYPRVDCAP